MMRPLPLALVLMVAPSLLGQDAPPAVPQAVQALEHLRPQPNTGPTSWTNGPYQYDGAGNIKAIGGEAYVYDKVGRLKTATLRGPDLTSMQTQSFAYDAYANLISTSKLGQTVNLDVATATNRLNALAYDASGNVITAGTQHYDYDAVGMLNSVRLGTNTQPHIIYAYTADDERLFAFDVSTGITHWTLRGLDNKVLRDFKQSGSTWTVERDYVYRDGLLLAALKSSGAVEHYSLDHLGTPRLVTDAAGHKIGYHVYWPFGEEWSPGDAQEASPLKFTGHERDADPAGGTAALDYMHARYYGAGWGRLLSVDPVLDWARALHNPQAWDRYAYVENNPVNRTDPTGKCGESAEFVGPRKPCVQVAREMIDKAAFTAVEPALTVMTGIINDSPKQVAKGTAELVGTAVAAGRLAGWARLLYTAATTTRLYRTVDSAEAADIQRTGQFRPSPNGTENKGFLFNSKDAADLGDKLRALDGEQYSVVGGRAPNSLVKTSPPHSAAGEGPGVLVPNERLPEIEPVPFQ